MTDHDLATMIREHVAGEPAYEHTTADVLTRGRRRMRRTRLAVTAAGVAVIAIAGAISVPRVLGDETGPDRVIDPAIASAIDTYDVTRMPQTMDDHARSILAASVPDLGPADFVAFDDQHQELPEHYWEMASGLVTRYGVDSQHRVNITLSHSRSEAEGDPDRYCSGGLEAGYYLECTVERTDTGDIVITKLGAMRPMQGGSGLQAWSDDFMAVTADELGSTNPERLWFSQDVKVIKSETFVTYVSEVVQAPDLATARERLVVPPADLATIGLDPALVMPEPPPGENGCPQWTMPTMDVSCSG
jgi:hypothetical protein